MSFFGFNININPGAIFSLLFLFFIIFTAIISLIMFWHWKRYGFGQKGIFLAEIVYLTGLVILGSGCFYELSFLQ